MLRHPRGHHRVDDIAALAASEDATGCAVNEVRASGAFGRQMVDDLVRLMGQLDVMALVAGLAARPPAGLHAQALGLRLVESVGGGGLGAVRRVHRGPPLKLLVLLQKGLDDTIFDLDLAIQTFDLLSLLADDLILLPFTVVRRHGSMDSSRIDRRRFRVSSLRPQAYSSSRTLSFRDAFSCSFAVMTARRAE